jgi:tetratricopeptide (TPR) repeat protein
MQVAHDELFRQAMSLWRQGDEATALHYMSQASALAPLEVSYPANLAAAYVELGEWSKAEAAARQALTIDPARGASWHGLGNALTGQQRWAEAAHAYEQAATLDPELPNCDHTAAQAWLRAGEHQRALQRAPRAATTPSCSRRWPAC